MQPTPSSPVPPNQDPPVPVVPPVDPATSKTPAQAVPPPAERPVPTTQAPVPQAPVPQVPMQSVPTQVPTTPPAAASATPTTAVPVVAHAVTPSALPQQSHQPDVTPPAVAQPAANQPTAPIQTGQTPASLAPQLPPVSAPPTSERQAPVAAPVSPTAPIPSTAPIPPAASVPPAAPVSPAAPVPPTASIPPTAQPHIPSPVAAPQPVAQPAPKPVAAAQPKKKLPPWLVPFATPQPGTPISSSKKLGVFSGITAAFVSPVAYGAAVGLTAFGMWYHLVHNKHLLEAGGTMSSLSFYGPIIGGTVLLLFFVAPFLLRRPQKQTTYRINTNENPALFALVEAIAAHVGAPTPTRISASLDNSIRVEKTDDSQIEVVLGLPLVAVQSARQTSGFLAHEFYKFSSHPSAKAWGLINIVRGLFARAAYECGETHQEIVEWGGTRRRPANVTFGFLPWLFDQFVAIFCEDLSVDAVLDADRSQTRVAGSNTFAMAQLDKRLLDELVILSQEGLNAARAVAQKSENLPAFYANKLNILKTEQPDYVKRICQDLMENESKTKPCIANRISVAQNYKDEGIFPADKPAAGLFKDFTRLCRNTTSLHYERHFGEEINQTKARIAEESARAAAEKQAADIKAQSDAKAAIAAQAAHAQAQKDATQQAALQAQQAAAAQIPAQTPAPSPNLAPIPVPAPVPNVPPLANAPTAAVPAPAVVPGAPIPGAPVQEAPIPGAPVTPPAPVTPQAPVPQPTPPQEPLPAVPAVASVPTVASAAPSADWTGPQDGSAQPIAPRPVDGGSPARRDGHNYLHTFLQTDVLTCNRDLFLPINETSAASNPEQSARTLLAARQRYEQVHVARKSDLNHTATGRLRLRSLQMARTMSLVGLPIDAGALGLAEGTNAAAAAACDQQAQVLNEYDERLKELRDQALTRFVMAIQLMETQIVAQSVGLQPNEIQSGRDAVSCLEQLRNILPNIDDLGRQQRQLRCLVFNVNGNEHLEELTTSLSLTASELIVSMGHMHDSLPVMANYAESLGITVPTTVQPESTDYQGIIKESGRLLTFYDQLYQQAFGTIAHIAERIEQHFGAQPFPELPTTGHRPAN